MLVHTLAPRKALNKAFLKVKPDRNGIEDFKKNLILLLEQIDESESEEFHKNIVSSFLREVYYLPNHYINTKGRNDLVVHNGKDAKSTVGIIIEAKKPNNKTEMLKKDNLNTKAFHELLLYYLRERITNKNLEVRHLIVTNIYEWYIFDTTVFEQLFAQNKELIKAFNDFEEKRLSGNKTDFFYKEIAEPFLTSITTEIEYTHFDIRDYERPLKDSDKENDKQLISLFKLLSPEHLLKLPFANDSNTLDKTFYAELLHIIGLDETKEGGKRLIGRKKESERNPASLIENAIIQLESLDKISRLEKPNQFGSNYDERLFNIALELTITWVNRILFLKLLEAQLITYHKGDKSYAFLNRDRIKDYDDLNNLFFNVLAKKQSERKSDSAKLFSNVPYLNSSLFEPTEIEHNTLFINGLRDERKLPVLSTSVLKDNTTKRRTGEIVTLEYFFEFLNAYDFASEGSEDIQEDNKTLINASVLGLIFEKINGYKDGSFFTPGFITMYMCKETIRRAVVQKFNEIKGWDCKEFDELYNKIDDREEANLIINSLKFCDPAVGSGHFLVSALNEIIAVKNDLKVLVDKTGKRLKEYQVEVVNDELIVTDEDGRLFEYHPKNKESQRVQETLFHEKELIIENCLFGVDINPNSVKICRLRLWIELLKNAYYKAEDELETLPNIDINIKNGNSLISRFDLNADLRKALHRSKKGWTIDTYKIAVQNYKNAESKEEKREMEQLIKAIKSDFRTEIADNDPKQKRLAKLSNELYEKYQSTKLFDESHTTAQKKDKKKLEEQINTLATEIESIKNNKMYENAFEWRFEFPEVLNDDGDFVGFDGIIGNPPYIRIQGIRAIDSKLADAYVENYKSASGSFDIYSLFVEKGLKLIKKDGIINYIMPVKWTNAAFGSGLRDIISESKAIYKIINFGSHQAFDASTYTGLQWFQKESEVLQYIELDKEFSNNNELGVYLNSLTDKSGTLISVQKLTKDVWTLTQENTSKIIDKLNLLPRRMSDIFDKIFQGLATSKDDVYFLYNCNIEENHIIGFSKQLDKLVKIEKDFTKPLLKGDDVHRYEKIETDRVVLFPYKLSAGGAELYKEEEIEKDFPNAYSYLKECEDILRDREKGRLKNDIFWYKYIYPKNLTLFRNEKLVAPEISLGGNFSYDQKGDFYSTTTIYGYIKKKEVLESYKTLMAILNSQLFWWYLVNTGTVLANGYFRYKPNYIKPFPLPIIPQKSGKLLDRIVDDISEIKLNDPSSDTTKLEEEINDIVFELYDITVEEKELISKF
jgi:adenine-specific DNA-methyltransferase